MKQLLFILTTLILASCSSMKTQRGSTDLYSLIKKFESIYNVNIRIPVRLTKDLAVKGKSVSGVCRIEDGRTKMVELDKDAWDQKNISQKEKTLFHELGHCALLIWEHDNRRDRADCPKSIMFSKAFNYTLDYICYKDNKEYYRKELNKKRRDNKDILEWPYQNMKMISVTD